MKRSRAEPSQAELKIVQLELWLGPSGLGIITTALFKRNLWPGLSVTRWLTRSFENSKAGGSNSSIGGGPINQENFPEKLSITLHIYVSKHASRHKLMDLEKLLMESQSSPVNRF